MMAIGKKSMVYSSEELAELLNVNVRTVSQAAKTSSIPGQIKFGHRFFYVRSKIDEWLGVES
tara:strand:- start:508 stop:693 length:186 start_codon:yes stop_codon:yes gene_type:complete